MNDGEIKFQVKINVNDAEQKIDSMSKKTEKLEKSFSGAGKRLTVGLTIPIAGLIASGMKYNTTMETMQTSFKTMTGSAEKAKSVMEELTKLGAETPFETSDLASVTQLLMNYGLTADDAISKMKMLGDISQGSADKMNRISMAYGQMSSAGKVSLEDVKQMIEAGFNPLKEISESTGESMSSLYDRISKGTISVDEITKSMERSTSAGGKYFGSMEAQSQTTAGKISTLKDNFNQATGSLTESLIPAFQSGIDKMNSFANWITSLDDNQKQAIVTVLKLLAVLGPLMLLISKGIGLYQKLAMAAKLFNMTTLAFSGTLGLIIIGIVAVIAIIYLLVKNWDTIKEAVGNALSAIGNFFSNLWNNITSFIGNIWSSITSFFSNVWNGIVSFFTPILAVIWAGIQMIISWITLPYRIMWNVFLLIVALVASLLESIFNVIKPIAMWIYNNILMPIFNFFVGIFNGIVNFISGFIQIVKNIFMAIVGFIYNNILLPVFNFFVGIFNGIWGVISSVIQKLKDGFSAAASFVKNVFNNLRDAIHTIFSTVAGIIKTPINGVIGLINNVLKSLNKIKVPDWVPGLGGMKVNFPMIPKLEVGTNYVAEEGLAYLHQGEAVVPKKYNPAIGGTTKQNAVNYITVVADMDVNKFGKAFVKDIKTFSGGSKNSYNYGGV